MSPSTGYTKTMVPSPLRRFRAASPLLKSGFGAVLLLGIALLSTGCHPRITDPKNPKFIVAEKGDWTITRGDLDQEINSYLQQHQMTMDQVPQANLPKLETFILDNMVLKKLLLAKAATLDLKDVDKDTDAQIDAIKSRVPPGQDFNQELKSVGITLDELKKRIREQVVIGKVLEAEAFKNDTPSEKEVSDFYMANKDKFNVPPQVRVSRILIMVDPKATPAEKAAKKKAIDKAHDRVAKGEDFAKVATAVSEDRYSAPRGGDVNWFKRGENEPKFDEVAFSTKQGAVSAVFESGLGYEFLKVTDVNPGGTATLAQVSPMIIKYLTQKKRLQEEDDYTKKLLADSGVTFYLKMVDLSAPATNAPSAAAPAPAPAASTNAASH